jgi:signal transduction histidine kinase
VIQRVLIAAVLALAALLGLQTLRLSNEREAHANTRTQAAEAKTAYADERTRVAVAFGKSITQALATQQELTTKAAKTQEKFHATVSDLAAARDDLLGQLRDAKAQARPDAADLRGAPEAAASAGVRPEVAGGLIPRRIGERDVRAHHRADLIRAFAIACDRQYNDAQASLEPMK